MPETKRNRGYHRVPPKPPSMLNARRGFCKLCSGAIMKKGELNRRAMWHPECALKWSIMNSPRDARYFVFVRDRSICSACGKNCQPEGVTVETINKMVESIISPAGDTMTQRHRAPLDTGSWELDHIVPLSEAAHLGQPLWMWMLSNIGTLCHGCHVVKTKKDRVIYAKKDHGILTTDDAIAALLDSGFDYRSGS